MYLLTLERIGHVSESMWYELAWNQKVFKEVQKEVLLAYCWLWVLQEAIPNENYRIALARVWIEEMPNVGCLS